MNRGVVAAVVPLLLASCGNDVAPAREMTTVGFVFVGARDDLGYNQAAWEGSESLARAFPNVEVLRMENVPETDAATEAFDALIDRGATILFATSFGYLDAAYEVAREHPEVTVLHQGGVEPQPGLDNFGTFFGAHSEAMYLSGVVAGSTTTTGRLGFVAAFPIPATYSNVNAFTLGAQSVNPEVTTEVRFTSDWCAPEVQRELARELLQAGVDVLAQHQDCTRTILEVAEEAGAWSVGYHADGSEVAARGWLLGAVWAWDDLYIEVVERVLGRSFAASPYNGDFRGTFASGDSPFIVTEPGPAVSEAGRAALEAARGRLLRGDPAFVGPIVDRGGTLRVPPGEALDVRALDAMDWFVVGVAGDVPE